MNLANLKSEILCAEDRRMPYYALRKADLLKLIAIAEAAKVMRSCPHCDLKSDGHGTRLIQALAALEEP